MANEPPITKTDIVAVREHTIGSRRTRAHVIVCHDLNHKSRALYEMFQFADKASPEALDALARGLANDIIMDADLLIRDLQQIRNYANRQIDRLNREADARRAAQRAEASKKDG